VAIVEPGTVATPLWEKSVARADRLVQALPPQAQTLYGAALTAVRAGAERTGKEGLGVPPEVVARAVAHALTAGKPKTRYLVGWDARMGVLFTLVPDRLRNRARRGRHARGVAWRHGSRTQPSIWTVAHIRRAGCERWDQPDRLRMPVAGSGYRSCSWSSSSP
jgi:hypothetical protein